MAASSPAASAIGIIPASNLCGGGANVEWSIQTLSIISPPPRNGGISSSSSRRPHSTPIPVGPQHLVAGEAQEVGPQLLHVNGHMRDRLGVNQHQRTGRVEPVATISGPG